MKTDKDIAIKIQLIKLVAHILQTDYCINADEIFITGEIDKLIFDNFDETDVQVMHKKAHDIANTVYVQIFNIQIHQAATELCNNGISALRFALKESQEKITDMIYEFLIRKNQSANCFSYTSLYEALSLNVLLINGKINERTHYTSIKSLQTFGFLDNDIILLLYLNNPDFLKKPLDDNHHSNLI